MVRIALNRLGMAEVTLTLADCNATLELDLMKSLLLDGYFALVRAVIS